MISERTDMGLVVINPGLCTTVQDEGRAGYREWGVSVGGAFDRGAMALANALLGNAPSCAVLELTLLGGVYEARTTLALALAGAPMEASIEGRGGLKRSLNIPQSSPLACGERLVLGGSVVGSRTYIAVKGGWQTSLILGSRSNETRLKVGDVLAAVPGTTLVRYPADEPFSASVDEPIRIIDGPDAPYLSHETIWEKLTFRIGAQSDRMGLRLRGATLTVAPQPERISTPVAPGAFQVAGGQAIILGAACGTMGGYPHVAHVISADLDRIGQARIGDLIRFRKITLEEARQLDRAARWARAARIRRLTTVAADVDIPHLSD